MKDTFENPSLPPDAGVLRLSATDAERGRVVQTRLGRVRLDKIVLFVVSLLLFIHAITLMKESTRALAPLVRDGFTVTNPANGLGFGWLFAYVVMSGSPVAAATLTFFNSRVIDEPSVFAIITGSRLGASFIVLFVGFIYVLRGRNRATKRILLPLDGSALAE